MCASPRPSWHLSAVVVAFAAAFIAGAALSGCGDGSGGTAGKVEGKVRIVVAAPDRVVTTSSDTAEIRGTVTPGATVSLDAGDARVDGDRFVATIRGLNVGQSPVAIRAAKRGLAPTAVTVKVRRRARAGQGKRASRRVVPKPLLAPPVRRPKPPPPPPPVDPGSRKSEAKVRRYLSRHYRDTAWFRSLTDLRIDPPRAFVITRLRKGKSASVRAAHEACSAVKQTGLPFPIRVQGAGGAILAVC